MAETAERESVSIEAHQRIREERDALKRQVDELSATVKDFGYLERATSWFSDKVDDPRGWAELALPHIRGQELDAIGDTLDSRFGARLPKTQPTPVAQSDTEVEYQPPIETPRPSVAGPNPAAPGEPVQAAPKFRFGDAEYQRIVSSEGLAGLRQAQAQGRFDPSAG